MSVLIKEEIWDHGTLVLPKVRRWFWHRKPATVHKRRELASRCSLVYYGNGNVREGPLVLKDARDSDTDLDNKRVGRDYTIAAVERSWQLLEAIASNPDLTLADLAAKTGMSRGLVFRLAFTLEKCGYIMRIRDRGGYKLSYRLFYLSARAQDQIPLIQVARPFVESLAQRTGLDVNLIVREGIHSLIVLSRHRSDPNNLYARAGRFGPLYAGGASKILLAFAPVEIQRQVLSSPMLKVTNKTVTDPEYILKQLAAIRETGFNETFGEAIPDGFGFAAAIYGTGDKVVASIVLAGNIEQLTADNRNDLRESVRETARRISENLGASNPDLSESL